MTKLTTSQRDQVLTQFMSDYSAIRKRVPFTKNDVSSFVGLTDDEMESSEVDLRNSVPVGAKRDWITNNPEVGRDLMVLVEKKRREVL